MYYVLCTYVCRDLLLMKANLEARGKSQEKWMSRPIFKEIRYLCSLYSIIILSNPWPLYIILFPANYCSVILSIVDHVISDYSNQVRDFKVVEMGCCGSRGDYRLQ